ncbi:MAG: class IV adenylate cyclase [Candidatus Kariarchaeaceae archaeon]|jgi:adenylate cyclase class 2
MIEIEIKIPVSIEDIKSKIIEVGALFAKTEENYDLYFNHPARDFGETDEAIRVRKVENSFQLTYKGPKIDTQSKSREELEISLNDDKIVTILDRLGFVESGIVKKHREVWKLGSFTFLLDSVEGLGEFLEVETVQDTKEDLHILVEKVHDLLRELGLDPANQIRQSYLELIQDLKYRD